MASLVRKPLKNYLQQSTGEPLNLADKDEENASLSVTDVLELQQETIQRDKLLIQTLLSKNQQLEQKQLIFEQKVSLQTPQNVSVGVQTLQSRTDNLIETDILEEEIRVLKQLQRQQVQRFELNEPKAQSEVLEPFEVPARRRKIQQSNGRVESESQQNQVLAKIEAHKDRQNIQLAGIIASLKLQLSEKDETIAQLRSGMRVSNQKEIDSSTVNPQGFV